MKATHGIGEVFMLWVFLSQVVSLNAEAAKKPNILLILTNQWRTQATGYAGGNVRIPNLDWLAEEGINLVNAGWEFPGPDVHRKIITCYPDSHR